MVQIHSSFEKLTEHIKNLVVKEKKLSKYKAIGETTQLLAHDIRKPFLQLRGFTKVIKNNLTVDQKSKFDPMLLNIDQSITDVNESLKDILDYGTLSSLSFKDFPLNSLLEEVLSFFATKCASKTIELSLEASRKHSVRADRGKIKRVMENLISNAIEATPIRGRVQLKVVSERSFVRVSIFNSGSYIPRERIEQIFSKSYTTKAHGNGLGLFISREIMSAHGGGVACYSKKDSGTTFVVMIPQS